MRKIIITSGKFIPSKGVCGPVLTPYMESKKEICRMLARGIEVEEVLSNGEHRKLDIPTTLEETQKVEKDDDSKYIHELVQPIKVEKPKVENDNKFNSNNQSRKNKKEKKKNKKRDFDFEIDTFEHK